jgi:hypothetical protein
MPFYLREGAGLTNHMFLAETATDDGMCVLAASSVCLPLASQIERTHVSGAEDQRHVVGSVSVV